MVLKLICMFKIHVLIICTMIIKEMMPHHLLKILIRFLAFLVNKMNLMFWQLCVCVCVCVCVNCQLSLACIEPANLHISQIPVVYIERTFFPQSQNCAFYIAPK